MTLVKTMSATVKSWSIALLALCAVAFASLASAQTWPMHKGHQQRGGNNGAPATTSPGAAVLNWFYPSPASSTQIETSQGSFVNYVGPWFAPVAGGAASDTFQFDGTGNPGPDAIEGINFNVPYLYANVIASDHITLNPLLPDAQALLVPGHALSIASFPIVTPLVQGNVAGDYALSVWLPAWPADINGNLTYPAEFIVFEIDYGTGLHFIDIVDRNQAGSGFVRLGNGGLPTTALFHYDGVNPITIHEYNTIPRDQNGNLIGVGQLGFGQEDGGPSTAFYTYANAVEATQTYGSVLSSPVIENDLTTGDARHVYVATNQTVNLLQNGQYVTQQKGVLSAYQSINTQTNPLTNLPFTGDGLQTVNWTFSPIDQGAVGLTIDSPSAGTQSTPGWFVGNNATFPPFVGYIGNNFLYEHTTNNPAAEDVASYGSLGTSNFLASGSYDVLMWTPGAQTAAAFAQFVQVEIDEGAAQTFLTVDLTATNGYQRLGGRRFVNTEAAPLVVKVTNFSATASDVGKFAYADTNAVRGNRQSRN